MQDFGFPRVKLYQNPLEVGKSAKVTSGKGAGEIIPESIAAGALTQMNKMFKWKKINYKTFLPKHSPIVVYIVAKTNTFDRPSNFGSAS